MVQSGFLGLWEFDGPFTVPGYAILGPKTDIGPDLQALTQSSFKCCSYGARGNYIYNGRPGPNSTDPALRHLILVTS